MKMKITKEQLRRMIQEEKARLNEAPPIRFGSETGKPVRKSRGKHEYPMSDNGIDIEGGMHTAQAVFEITMMSNSNLSDIAAELDEYLDHVTETNETDGVISVHFVR